jgi:hypothetical protein
VLLRLRKIVRNLNLAEGGRASLIVIENNVSNLMISLRTDDIAIRSTVVEILTNMTCLVNSCLITPFPCYSSCCCLPGDFYKTLSCCLSVFFVVLDFISRKICFQLTYFVVKVFLCSSRWFVAQFQDLD